MSRTWEDKSYFKQTRRLATVQLRQKFFIFTEGETEESYFSNYNQQPDNFVRALSKGDSKRSLIEQIVETRARLVRSGDYNEEVDVTWAVFDRDEDHDKRKDKDLFNQALDLAARSNIKVAYSNDAFELWVLLHLQEVQAGIHRDDLIKKIEGHLKKKYEKGKRNDIYRTILPYRLLAIKRAKQLASQLESISICDANPSTSIYNLVEDIMRHPGFRDDTDLT